MAKRKVEIIERPYDPQGWMVTFSDMLNLLLVFFVMLLTMKSMDTKQFRQAFGDVRPDVGVLTEGGSLVDQTPNIVPVIQRRPPSGTGQSEITTESEAYHELLAILSTVRSEEFRDLLALEITEQGIVVRFRADLTFQPNSDTLRPEAARMLHALTPLLCRLRFPLRIEGHTAAPRSGEGDPRAQMSLSLRRAHAVLVELTDRAEVPVPESKFTMAGLGAQRPRDSLDNRPAAPSDPRQGRVEIIIQTRIQAVDL